MLIANDQRISYRWGCTPITVGLKTKKISVPTYIARYTKIVTEAIQCEATPEVKPLRVSRVVCSLSVRVFPDGQSDVVTVDLHYFDVASVHVGRDADREGA
jgi:hypothetical protein